MIGRLLSKLRWPALAMIVGLLAALVLGGWWLWATVGSGQSVTASFEQRLPERPSSFSSSSSQNGETAGFDQQRSADQPSNLAFTQPEANSIKPAAPDLDLVDASPAGPLPRISTDGRLPLMTYGRPYDKSDERPKIAIMVTGLGPISDATAAAFHLPAAMSLSFSPYTEDLPSLFERARLAGHEVLIELPMEPDDYPNNDPGPHTLRASGTVDANLERLTWVLSRAPGYFAVTGPTGVFGQSPEAIPMIEAIASKGLGMVEIDNDTMSREAEEGDLPYLSAHQWIDEVPSSEAIEQALSNLEAEAKENGAAVGIAEAYPITLQRLAEWASTLDQRGLALTPVSAILIERSGVLGADDQATGSNVAQSQN